jgi:hypothetical protein
MLYSGKGPAFIQPLSWEVKQIRIYM